MKSPDQFQFVLVCLCIVFLVHEMDAHVAGSMLLIELLKTLRALIAG